MKIKHLSLLLALVMILSAFAGTFTFAGATGEKVYIGETAYASLTAALSAAKETLAGDATEVTIEIRGDLSDGDTSTTGAFHSISVPSGKTLTIKGKSGKYDGTEAAARYPRINSNTCRYIQTAKASTDSQAGELIIKDLTIEGTGHRAVIQIGAGKSTVTLDNAKIINSGTAAVNTIVVQNSCTLNVTNGSVVEQSNGATYDTTNYKFTGTGHAAVLLNENSAKCIVDNATVQATGAGAYAIFLTKSGGGTNQSLTLRNGALVQHTGGNATGKNASNETVTEKGRLIYTNTTGVTINVENSFLYQTMNTAPIWVSANDATINIEGTLQVHATTAAHAVITNDTLTTRTTVNIEDAVIANYYGNGATVGNTSFTRFASCYSPATFNVTNSVVGITMYSNQSHGLFEFLGTGTKDNRNILNITDSTVTSSSATAPVIQSEKPYTDITITRSNLVSGKVGIDITAAATNNTVTIEDSRIIAKGGVAISAASDTVVKVKKSGLSAAADSVVTGPAAPTYESVYAKTNAGISALGGATAISADNADEVAAAVGLPFRVKTEAEAYNSGAFDGYYATPNTAVTNGLNVTMVGDYVTNGDVVTLENTSATVANPIVIEMNGHKMVATVFNRIANPKSHITFKNGSLEGYEASGVLQLNGNVVLTLDNVDMVANAKLNNAPIVVTKTGSTVNVINGSTITVKMAYNNHVFYTTQDDTVINVVDSTITKEAIVVPQNFTGGNSNIGIVNNEKICNLTVDNSTIDFSKDYKGRFIHFTDAERTAASNLTLINANLIVSCGSGAISWWGDGTGLHMYGNNTFTGGDRLVEFGAAGANSLYYLGADKDSYGIDTKFGASVRTVKDSSGIRFISHIPAEVVSGLAASKTIESYSFGTVIVKAEDLKTSTIEALVADNTKHVDIPATKGIKDVEDGIELYAAMINIQPKHYNTEFAGVAYIELTIKNGDATSGITIRIYSDYVEEENARSIEYVAKRALASTSTTKQTVIQNGYRADQQLAEGEKYYVYTEATDSFTTKNVAVGEVIYSPYTETQRDILKGYVADYNN